ncbi:Non-specific serine/threonine protein kinase, partial [Bertholletia excelsa]
FISLLLISHTHPSVASGVLSPTQNLTDGQTLVSSNQRFELGFFNRSSSQNLYLGVWYHDHPDTVVWVANRRQPITGKSGCLTLSNSGTLFLYDGSTTVVWSNNITITANNPILQLLDSGNLVVREKQTDAGDTFIWESFDFIADTLLPGMKLGWKLRPRVNRVMTSWKSNDDPSEGDFTFGLDSADAPQLVLSKDSEKQYRWGPWDGSRFSGSEEFKRNPVFIPIFVSNQEELYYTYQVLNDSIISRFVVTSLGSIQYLTLRNGEWVMMVTLNREYCDRYRMCGPYGNCYAEDPNCKCLKGFTPSSPQDWNTVDWSGGCRRKHELKCGDGDGFVKYEGLKLPDHSVVWANQSHSAQECRRACLNKCECMAYTIINVTGDGPKCVVWLGDLLDLRSFPDGGEKLFIRMARAELVADAKRKRQDVMIVVVVLCTLFGMILSAVFGYYIYQLRDCREESQDSDLELPIFDLDTIFAATDEFSSANKIGQGGFGPVYKIKVGENCYLGESASTSLLELLVGYFTFMKTQD